MNFLKIMRFKGFYIRKTISHFRKRVNKSKNLKTLKKPKS